MAKLTDISHWIEAMLLGDGARARSLIQIGRKNGLFSTGGRGKGAPEMTPRDAASAVLLTLYDGPPTECFEFVKRMTMLPLELVEIYPDGPREKGSFQRFRGNDLQQSNIPLPSAFRQVPFTPLDALSGIFAANNRPYNLDHVKFIKGMTGDWIGLDLHDLEKVTNTELASETDFFLFSSIYMSRTNQFRHCRQSEHSFSGAELDTLYCLIHGIELDYWESDI